MELFEEIVMAVNEELGISDVVTNTTNEIISLISKDGKKKPLFKNKKNGEIKGFNLFGKKILIKYALYFVDSIDDIKKLKIAWSGSYNDTTRTLETTVVYCKKENKYIDYVGSTQHEVEHAYQTSKTRKSLVSKNSTGKMYMKAKSLMRTNEYAKQVVGYTIYYACKFEKDAYENSVYKMISDNWEKDPIEILKGTTIYQNLKIISNQANMVSPGWEQTIENICVKEFGRHFKWWQNLAKKTVSGYMRKFGKMIAKVEKDRGADRLTGPNSVITEMPRFIEEE